MMLFQAIIEVDHVWLDSDTFLCTSLSKISWSLHAVSSLMRILVRSIWSEVSLIWILWY